MRVTESPVYGHKSGFKKNETFGMYHFDAPKLDWSPMVSIWLAVTDAPYPVEFLRGSKVLRTDNSSETLKCHKSFAVSPQFLAAHPEYHTPPTTIVYNRDCAIGRMGG